MSSYIVGVQLFTVADFGQRRFNRVLAVFEIGVQFLYRQTISRSRVVPRVFLVLVDNTLGCAVKPEGQFLQLIRERNGSKLCCLFKGRHMERVLNCISL